MQQSEVQESNNADTAEQKVSPHATDTNDSMIGGEMEFEDRYADLETKAESTGSMTVSSDSVNSKSVADLVSFFERCSSKSSQVLTRSFQPKTRTPEMRSQSPRNLRTLLRTNCSPTYWTNLTRRKS